MLWARARPLVYLGEIAAAPQRSLSLSPWPRIGRSYQASFPVLDYIYSWSVMFRYEDRNYCGVTIREMRGNYVINMCF